MSAMPSMQEFWTAANLVMADNAEGKGVDNAPPAATGLKVLVDSTALNARWISDGFFAQAFEDSSGNVIISYECSISNGDTSPYALGSLAADAKIAVGGTPQAYLDASAFAQYVQQYVAHNLGSSHPIYLTGHSLGGGEAEYAASVTHLSGVTFGAPGGGLFTFGHGPVAGQTFINYEDQGDPIGNFGIHFGTVQKVGPVGDILAHAFNPVAAAEQYHPMDHYALDLNLMPAVIQSEHLAITRTWLSTAQATTIANEISSGQISETQYINSLLSQVASTTAPAVAVEASMYGAVGSSAEISHLVNDYLPGQIAYATQHGINPTIYAAESLGSIFAFANENGQTTFASNYGPSNHNMPDTATGDARFAAAAVAAIFGAQATPSLVNFIGSQLASWEQSIHAQHQTWTADQVDLAARGTVWGEAVGIALVNHQGPLPGQVTNFLEDAAMGGHTAPIYSAPLSSQPTAVPFHDFMWGG